MGLTPYNPYVERGVRGVMPIKPPRSDDVYADMLAALIVLLGSLLLLVLGAGWWVLISGLLGRQ
jgi:hypothetical protein